MTTLLVIASSLDVFKAHRAALVAELPITTQVLYVREASDVYRLTRGIRDEPVCWTHVGTMAAPNHPELIDLFRSRAIAYVSPRGDPG